ncbi:beta-ketoacyl synthase chain length factor [Acetobacter lambici]|uniref:Beta-ketoacyl synthase chain length factor n=1 Tax=Acetobacter lambici TaxID=1332824 RepID=A0ABT1F0J6_9PROT|nr:beta-ketoacyl synthase chain length factor [Acetobacter lambici]MCP1258732.1 beta-ketoacyl synthase chain length factor [Acetobacter lambici]
MQVPPAACLPANERRRCGPLTRLAIALADEACAQAEVRLEDVRGVFASSNGDGAVVDGILSALTTPGGEVSPTQFHNSVHNAAAGYWTIGHAILSPVVALGSYDWSFAQGLLKAAAECVVENAPVLFVAYDLPIPGPIGKVRVTRNTFGCAFVLLPQAGQNAICTLDITHTAKTMTYDEVSSPQLAELARTNPAAGGLALLQRIASVQAGAVHLASQPGTIRVEVLPC